MYLNNVWQYDHDDDDDDTCVMHRQKKTWSWNTGDVQLLGPRNKSSEQRGQTARTSSYPRGHCRMGLLIRIQSAQNFHLLCTWLSRSEQQQHQHHQQQQPTNQPTNQTKKQSNEETNKQTNKQTKKEQKKERKKETNKQTKMTSTTTTGTTWNAILWASKVKKNPGDTQQSAFFLAIHNRSYCAAALWIWSHHLKWLHSGSIQFHVFQIKRRPFHVSGHAVWRRNRHWTFEVAVPLYCWMIWIWMNNDISLTDTYDYIMQQWNNMIPNIPSYPSIN